MYLIKDQCGWKMALQQQKKHLMLIEVTFLCNHSFTSKDSVAVREEGMAFPCRV